MSPQLANMAHGAQATSAVGAMGFAPGAHWQLFRSPFFIPGTGALPSVQVDWDDARAPVPQTNSGRQPLEADTAPLASSTASEADPEVQTCSAAIMELRRLAGLTWEQLADLLDVARRSLHFWASGKPVNAANEERLRRVLAAVRQADRGSAALNRMLLLQDRDGVVPLDLLVRCEFDAFLKLVGEGPGRREPKLTPLSPEAREARKPLPPEELVGALQDRVHIDVGKARAARSAKVKRQP